MKNKVLIKKQRVEHKTQAPAIQRRINGGWLKIYRVQSLRSKVQSHKADAANSQRRRPAAVELLERYLCVVLSMAFLGAGCAGPRALQGGKAVTTRQPSGQLEQTLLQGENPAQRTRQDQQSVRVRTYTLPAGSRIEQCPMPSASANSPSVAELPASTLNLPLSTTFVLSSPMPVTEREESEAATELGAAQKDTAREIGAKLSSLRGIVWVGVGLFVFGIASLVWPPLKLIVGSVTTSVALALGGLALMILPSVIVGNELLILGGVGLVVGSWFLAHRHGQLRGEVSSLKSKV